MITLLIAFLVFKRLIYKQAGHRWDGNPAFPYFSASDFRVSEERFSFRSGKWNLDGSRYFSGPGPYKALVVVFHGISAGRNAYIRSICEFANRGYLVYAFDYTGSMRSEGDRCYGLAHVYNDVKAFYAFLDKDPKAQGLSRYSWGHSWGGYAALLSANPAYRVEKVVSLSGFIDETYEYSSFDKRLQNPIILWLFRLHSRFVEKTPVTSALPSLDESKARILYFQGSKDDVVIPAFSGEILKKRYGGRKNFSFLFLPDRDHNIDRSQASSDYLSGLLKQGLGKINGDPALTMDIDKATDFDPKVMKATFDFLAQ
ncbi:MAG: alpha/beta hydrolase [Bacilli bacterium]|jgi:pimeloyl-ACP methyl ester carboxylesterase|nr:alpha/beta hydrolase [Bacilli bacterium]